MNRTSILNDYATDMLAVEKHIFEAVERQVNDAATKRYPVALSALQEIHRTLSRHVSALEAYNATTEGGGLKEALKETLTGALGVAAGIYDKIRSEDKVSRMVRDTYTALGLATISYHMLYTTALGLKEEQLATLALNHLKDLSPLVVELSKAVCLVVAQELNEEDKLIDASVGDEAVRRTQEAWSGEHVESGA
jgi:hypothetical protein